MKQTEPPAIATWMLEHLSPEDGNEALAGDLLEEFQIGRTSRWYWRQVLAAIVIGFFRELRNHWPAVVFAALWSLTAPGYSLYTRELEQHADIIGRIYQLDWPYSTILILALSLGLELLFVWMGLTVYLLLRSLVMRNFHTPRFMRGLFVSLPMLIVATAGLAILPAGHPIDVRHITPLSAIYTRLGLLCLPSFLSLLVAIWVATPCMENRNMRVTS